MTNDELRDILAEVVQRLQADPGVIVSYVDLMTRLRDAAAKDAPSGDVTQEYPAGSSGLFVIFRDAEKKDAPSDDAELGRLVRELGERGWWLSVPWRNSSGRKRGWGYGNNEDCDATELDANDPLEAARAAAKALGIKTGGK